MSEKLGRILMAAVIGGIVGIVLTGITLLPTPSRTVLRDDSGVAQLDTATAVTTPTGLRYQDLVVGTGPSPANGQTVIVQYRGRLTDGTVFDESRPRGEPFRFKLGEHQVISGWDEGVATMKKGGVRRLVVPPFLGYGGGSAPGGKIPPDSTLVFDIELLGIE
jgi:peptidylprolyl isomerase